MPSHFLELPHASLEYARSGTPLNDTLTYVFLHEGLGCVELWKGFPERLAETPGFLERVQGIAGTLKGKLECLGGTDDYAVNVMHERAFRFMHRV